MRTLFLGNHDVGIAALEVLARESQLVGVVAHPPDPEEGRVYASVHDWAVERGLPVLRARGRDAALLEFARNLAPELLWVADYRYLLPQALLALAPLGAVNLHPSLLPAYRGRAPINWAILRGERYLGLSAHRIDEGVDTGALLAQRAFELAEDEDVGDALAKLLPLYTELSAQVLRGLEQQSLCARPQLASDLPVCPRRRPEDGRIDWHRSAREVRDLVRALAHPYPGAFSLFEGGRVRLWRAAVEVEALPRVALPGELLAAGPLGLRVACGQGVLHVRAFDFEGCAPRAGARFETAAVGEGQAA